MSTSQSGYELERAVLDGLVPGLVADGFQIVIHPKQDSLPSFFQGYQPDLVAYRKDKKVAFEIRGGTVGNKEGLLRQRFNEHPEWELRFVYAPPLESDANIPVVSRQIISEHLDHLDASVDAMGLTAALLTGWAVFEAAARAQLPLELKRPQPPARLIEALASVGHVTPDEADALRRVSRMRNELAHGRLDVRPSRSDVALLISIAREMLRPEPQEAVE